MSDIRFEWPEGTSEAAARSMGGLLVGTAFPFLAMAAVPAAAPAAAGAAALLVGGAVGGLGQAWIQGDLHDLGDCAEAIGWGGATALGVGLVGRAVGQVVTKSLPNSWLAREMEPVHWQAVTGSFFPAMHRATNYAFGKRDELMDNESLGGGTVPIVEIAEIEIANGTPPLEKLFMPTVLDPNVEGWFRTVPDMVRDHLALLGTGDISPVVQPPDPGGLHDDPNTAGIATYVTEVDHNAETFDRLSNSDTQIVGPVEQAGGITAGARSEIARVIRYLTAQAPVAPPPGIDQNDWTSQHLTHALEMLDGATTRATEQLARLTVPIGQLTASITQLT